MRTRLMLAAVCMLILPLTFSTSGRGKPISYPFATTAYAGHTTSGNWCECGGGGCQCDPGEIPGGNSATPVTDNGSSDQRPSPVRAHPRSGSDYGTGALILALALFMWQRLRA